MGGRVEMQGGVRREASGRGGYVAAHRGHSGGMFEHAKPAAAAGVSAAGKDAGPFSAASSDVEGEVALRERLDAVVADHEGVFQRGASDAGDEYSGLEVDEAAGGYGESVPFHAGMTPTFPVIPPAIDATSSASDLARRVRSSTKLAPVVPPLAFPSGAWQPTQ